MKKVIKMSDIPTKARLEKASNNSSTNALKFVLNNKALILLVVAFAASVLLTGSKTLNSYNLTSLLRQIPAYSIVAIGYTLVFASGQFDMSAGAVLSLCSVMYAKWSLTQPLFVAMVGVIILGIFCEFVNGLTIRLFNLNGFVLTLASSLIFQGIAGQITQGQNISGLSDAAKFLGQSLLFKSIPFAFIVAIAMILLAAMILYKSLYGRHLLATGGNLEAAQVSGIKIDRIRVTAFAFIGLCVGVTSILLTGRLGLGSMSAGNDYTLDCIAAVVIGGTTMHGGKAKVGGTLFGMFLIVVINNMLDLLGIGTYWKMITKGLIIIIAIVMDSTSQKFAVTQRTKG